MKQHKIKNANLVYSRGNNNNCNCTTNNHSTNTQGINNKDSHHREGNTQKKNTVQLGRSSTLGNEMTATGKPRETPNFIKGNHTHQTIHFPGHNMNQATHPNREGHSVERTPPPHNASSTRTCRVQYIFEI